MEPPHPSSLAGPAPIPVSPAAFLLEIRRRRADLAEVMKTSQAAIIPPSVSSPVATAPNALLPASAAAPAEEGQVVRWMQRIDDRLGAFDSHMTRMEAMLFGQSSTSSGAGAASEAFRKLAADLERQRSAYLQMLTTSEAVVAKLVRENSDLKDKMNQGEADDTQLVRFCGVLLALPFISRLTYLFSIYISVENFQLLILHIRHAVSVL